MTIRVVLADDEPLVRAGIAMLLSADPDIDVVAEVGDGEAAVEAARCSHPDVVVMDIRMPGIGGVEATRLIGGLPRDPQSQGLPVSVLVLTTYNVDEAVFGALRAGAAGFLLKDAAPGELVDAIKSVAGGQGWLDPAVTRSLIREFAACGQADARLADPPCLTGEAQESPVAIDAVQAQRDGDPRYDRGVFRKDGEYWTISYEGNLFHLKDSTGLHYLSRLLREPGREFHALDLSRSDEGCPLRSRPSPGGCFEQPPSPVGLGSAGELLDQQAKAAYRRRMQELREELEEAVAWADTERASMLRRELEIFSEELARGVGLGGRDRIAASASERARVNVTKAIRSAVRRIGRCNPPLADHFGFAVRTGTFCSYDPDARSAVVWDS